jgi:hypothetical protein
LPQQAEFTRQVTAIWSIQEKQSDARRRLDDLFQSLLHRAFEGEL